MMTPELCITNEVERYKNGKTKSVTRTYQKFQEKLIWYANDKRFWIADGSNEPTVFPFITVSDIQTFISQLRDEPQPTTTLKWLVQIRGDRCNIGFTDKVTGDIFAAYLPRTITDAFADDLQNVLYDDDWQAMYAKKLQTLGNLAGGTIPHAMPLTGLENLPEQRPVIIHHQAQSLDQHLLAPRTATRH